MRPRLDPWLRRVKLWAPALAFVLVNLALLLGYQIVVQARVAAVTSELEGGQQELAESVERRQEREGFLATARRTEQAVRDLRTETLGTEAARLTEIMLRVKQLLRQAGLSGPASIRYQDEALPEYALDRKTISFGVSGSYEQLRRFINFLELSESFLVLEEVSVSEVEGGNLEVRLRLSTLFDAERTPREGTR